MSYQLSAIEVKLRNPMFVVGALAPKFVVGALAPKFVVGALVL
jgi:hypothetical protein